MTSFARSCVQAALRLCLLAAWAGCPAVTSQLDAASFRDVPKRLQPFVEDHTIAGAVTLVASRGELGAVDALGWADLAERRPMQPDSLFWIASMTKPITAAAVLLLQDEGKLSVDDPVEKHLPEFKGQWLIEARSRESMTLKRPPRSILIRDLLTHTSGLGDVPAPRPDSSLAELVAAYAQAPLQFPPGSRWSYSNAGINTLGRLVEVVSHQPYVEFLEARIFQPLGMIDTTFWPTAAQAERLARSYQPAPDGRGLEPVEIYFIRGELSDRKRTALPAGGLFSTARDYYRFCQMLLNRGKGNGRQLISAEAIQSMTQVQTGDLAAGFTDGMGFGFGVGVVKQPQGVTAMLSPGTFGHGGAYGTQAWVDPKKELILVLMIQRAKLPNADASEVRKTLQTTVISALQE